MDFRISQGSVVTHLIITLANVDRFSKFFYLVICKKIFYIYTSQRFPSHLQCVATLPCEIRKSINVTKFLL